MRLIKVNNLDVYLIVEIELNENITLKYKIFLNKSKLQLKYTANK